MTERWNTNRRWRSEQERQAIGAGCEGIRGRTGARAWEVAHIYTGSFTPPRTPPPLPPPDLDKEGRVDNQRHTPRNTRLTVQPIGATSLKNYGLLPYQRTAELFEDLFSIPISVGTLVSINELCGQQLEAVNDTIRSALRDESVIGVDETGMSVEGKLWWLHVASTELLTCYTPHRKRGREAMAEIGILPDFGGVAVHDHWQSYFGYDCHHGLCNAHHLRELTFIEEQYGQAWASDLQDLLLRVKEAVASAVLAGRSRLYGPVRDRFAAEYRRIIKAGMRANPPPPATQTRKRGRRKQSKPRNLLLRLASRWREVLAFMYDFRVPFTNNQAERDLRMMKVQQKISGTFRSEDGAVAFCQTRSYISTIRKNGGNVIDALTSVFAGNP